MTRLSSFARALVLVMLCGCGDGDPAGASSASAPPSTTAAAPAAPAASTSTSAAPVAAPGVDPWLDRALRAADPRWEAWLADAEALRLQILVTVVDGSGTWQTHELRADAEYFYPASAIKTFLAVASLR
ncbi:MAG: hypothetical protein HOV80_12915, partial [Polyangiaceae bacterium]|nr:hypothetical protein [Polyangiaceae bacterium]